MPRYVFGGGFVLQYIVIGVVPRIDVHYSPLYLPVLNSLLSYFYTFWRRALISIEIFNDWQRSSETHRYTAIIEVKRYCYLVLCYRLSTIGNIVNWLNYNCIIINYSPPHPSDLKKLFCTYHFTSDESVFQHFIAVPDWYNNNYYHLWRSYHTWQESQNFPLVIDWQHHICILCLSHVLLCTCFCFA